jgi:hypothetical protein
VGQISDKVMPESILAGGALPHLFDPIRIREGAIEASALLSLHTATDPIS